MKILLHSSKTMKPTVTSVYSLTTPQCVDQAAYLNGMLRSLTTDDLAKLMVITAKLAATVKERIDEWSATGGTAAALTFRGDIYSGLCADQWGSDAAEFAQNHLLILSGLYGLLRPFDAIHPYRLEMGYKLMIDGVRLDTYWTRQLVGKLDTKDVYINLTSDEYFKVIKDQLRGATVISPKFLTVNKTTGQPIFVTVHAKIARGSFANWLITNWIDDLARLSEYNELNYVYDPDRSTGTEPVFVCNEFGGLGLSVRLR